MPDAKLPNSDAGINLQSRQTLHGRAWSLSGERFYEDGYSGCGNGFIVVDKELDEVIEMSYAADGKTIDRAQNVLMCDDAGRVLAEDSETIAYRANFSCWVACLF